MDKYRFNACLVVRAKKRLKNSFTTTAPNSIGYVSNGDYYIANWGNKELYITEALFPKTRGDKWALIGLINNPADVNLEIIGTLPELPRFQRLNTYLYRKE